VNRAALTHHSARASLNRSRAHLGCCLAVAIAYRAIQNGFEALFTTAAELIEDLSNASQKGHLHQSLSTCTHPHVLVVDEVGYLTYGPDAANVLFHVVNVRHLKKRPMIFTTNKLLHQWGRVLHDEIWLLLSSIEFSSEEDSSTSTDLRPGRAIFSSKRAWLMAPSLPEFPESVARISGTYSLQPR
jgi:hypothetical protein